MNKKIHQLAFKIGNFSTSVHTKRIVKMKRKTTIHAHTKHNKIEKKKTTKTVNLNSRIYEDDNAEQEKSFSRARKKVHRLTSAVT